MDAGILHRELEDAGISFHGVNSSGQVFFTANATPADKARANTVVANHNPNYQIPLQEKLDRSKEATQRLLMAITLKLSSSWQMATVQEKQRIDQIINTAGSRIIQLIR